jgi:hypothetical protein
MRAYHNIGDWLIAFSEQYGADALFEANFQARLQEFVKDDRNAKYAAYYTKEYIAFYESGAAELIRQNLDASAKAKQEAAEKALQLLIKAGINELFAVDFLLAFIIILGWQFKYYGKINGATGPGVGWFYEGELLNGKMHGKGALSTTTDDGYTFNVRKGTFINGEFQG